jgi:DNA end-binding protein Ku
MAIHSSWKGYLKVSLVSVPLKAYTASSTSSRSITLNQLHEPCKNRINYKKTCPVHGEVQQSEIVSGYEFAKGQYAVINPDEIEKLRPQGDKSITVDNFVPAESIDPLYLSGQTYYLVPDGPIGLKPYVLIRQSMEEKGVHAIGQVVISGREKLVRIRPLETLLAMDVLQYDSQVKKPQGFEDEIKDVASSPEELELTKSLLGAMTTDEFDIAAYKDVYTEKLGELIEAKVQGKELVSPPAAAEPAVINLMDALKESVKRVKVPGKADAPAAPAAAVEETAKKPPKKMAESASTRAEKKTSTRKKKSG